MKYFIDQDTHWDYKGYAEQFGLLEERLSKRAFNFFRRHSFHDALVVSFNILNGYQLLKRRQINPTFIEAKLVDYMNDYEYIVYWKGVVAFDFFFDGRRKGYIGEDEKLHYYEEDWSGLDEWAYDELTILDDKYLSHEIELHSGARITIHFKSLDFKRSQKKVKKKWNNKLLVE